jgi:large subunit ribosomal protein L25
MEVDLGIPLTISIPVNVVGNAPGVRAGGRLMIKIKKLVVKGMVKDIPDSIEINVDKLEIGQNIRVGDIKLNGLELLDTKANSVVSVTATRASISAATEEAKKK